MALKRVLYVSYERKRASSPTITSNQSASRPTDQKEPTVHEQNRFKSTRTVIGQTPDTHTPPPSPSALPLPPLLTASGETYTGKQEEENERKKNSNNIKCNTLAKLQQITRETLFLSSS